MCENGSSDIISQLSGNSGQLEQRIDNMRGYQRGSNEKGSQMMIAMVSSAALFLTTAVCAMIPDFFVLQDIGVNLYGTNDNISCTLLENNTFFSQERTDCQLQRDTLVRYTLKPGERIRSETFQAAEGDQLSLLLISSRKEYEVGLIAQNKKMMIPHDQESISVNLELTEMEYNLYICNQGERNLEIELYCTQSRK